MLATLFEVLFLLVFVFYITFIFTLSLQVLRVRCLLYNTVYYYKDGYDLLRYFTERVEKLFVCLLERRAMFCVPDEVLCGVL